LRPRATASRSALGYRGQEAGPDDVIDCELGAEDDLTPIVEVDDCGEPRIVNAEEIEERAVLSEVVGVGRVIHWALVVAEEEQDAARKLLA
jgi:hypothetical protein